MTYPTHWLLTFGGTLLSNRSEIWTNSIRFAPDVEGQWELDQQETALEMLNTLSARWGVAGDGGCMVSGSVFLEWAKFNEIGPDGKYADGTTTHEAFLATPKPGIGAPGAGYVPQITSAISWQTTRQRGPASKGRIFLPMPVMTMTGAGRIDGNGANDCARAWANTINALNDVVALRFQSDAIRASVVSDVGQGAAAHIASVRVGNVYDTQRRRRNALEELYYTSPVAL